MNTGGTGSGTLRTVASMCGRLSRNHRRRPLPAGSTCTRAPSAGGAANGRIGPAKLSNRAAAEAFLAGLSSPPLPTITRPMPAFTRRSMRRRRSEGIVASPISESSSWVSVCPQRRFILPVSSTTTSARGRASSTSAFARWPMMPGPKAPLVFQAVVDTGNAS